MLLRIGLKYRFTLFLSIIPEGKILFDLGCHPEASAGHWCPELVNIFPFTFEEHQRLENQLKLINSKPEDISTVILSHMHLDHIGNIELEKEGVLIFPMDAIYNKTVYGPPARASGLVYDSLAFFKSIERVRNLAKKYQAQVMFSHDMAVFETMKKVPDYYC